MLRFGTLAIVPVMAWTLSAQPNPTAQQKEVVEWVVRSLIQQQQYDWSDWSSPTDRRVVLVANETIPFPTFGDDVHGLSYALASLKTERSDLYARLRSADVVDLGAWTPAPPTHCGQQNESFPQVNVVPARSLMQSFEGEPLDVSVALAIRLSTPVFSNDGRAAAVYVEAIGSHADNAQRQLISLTRNHDRPGEWDATIQSDRLFPAAKATGRDREISATDRAVMTAGLEWLVMERGEFDLVGLADFPPRPAEWRRRERESQTAFEIPEATLAQLSRRNSHELEFDPLIFSIKGVRSLPVGDGRLWSRPSVLVSLPAYDGTDVAVLSITYRTSSEIPETANYLVSLRRSSGAWIVVSTTVQEGIIFS